MLAKSAKEIVIYKHKLEMEMKEYLNKTTYEYKRAHRKPDGEWVCIPDGAEVLSTDGDGVGLVFWKDGFNLVVGLDDHWDETFRSFKDFFPMYPRCKVLWQRPSHPEALPFIDDNPQSLNEQYAEIEQVRQNKKHERNSSAWDVQVGGDHYKQFQVQPMQFALENKLDAAQQNVIKYIMRHSFKNGKQDLEKAKHYIDLMIEFYYGDNNNG